MAEKQKKSKSKYKNLGPMKYEEGSLADIAVEQIKKEGWSSTIGFPPKAHDYLRRKGFFSPKGTLPKKKVEPSGLGGKARVMKKGGKVSCGSPVKIYKKGGYVEGE